MWGSFCSCRVPCPTVCYRRSIPCTSPCYSYARGTCSPSPISSPLSTKRKNEKKKKIQNVRKNNAKINSTGKVEGDKIKNNKNRNMTPWQLALLTKNEMERMTPSQISLFTPSVQTLILKRMQHEGISLDKFVVAGIIVDANLVSSGYATSEGGYVMKRCDPRCKAWRKRPVTANNAPKRQMRDFCSSRCNMEMSVCCGSGGIYRSDASTTTDIKTNTSTSANNINFSCTMQKVAADSMLSDICSNQQYTQAMQQQYHLALQQQWLHNYCQVLTQQNPFGTSFGRSHELLRNSPQSVSKALNTFQGSIQPCSLFFNGSLPYSTNQSILPSQNMTASGPSVSSKSPSAYIPPTVQFRDKTCATCGCFSDRRY